MKKRFRYNYSRRARMHDVAMRWFFGRGFRARLARGFGVALAAIVLSACSPPTKVPTMPAKSEAPPEYQIQPGDRLFVSVWGEEVLQQGVLVQPDGGLSFPLAGQIQAEGLTIGELEKELNKRLSPYIPEPAVSVSLLETLGYRIYVLGRVTRPGEYVLSRQVDVLQALALAGGLTPFADEDGIVVFRGQAPRQKAFGFNYEDVAAGSNLHQNIILAPGDTIVVP